MGEISEALQRARRERETHPEPAVPAPAPRVSSEDVYTTSARLSEEQRADGAPAPTEPAPAAPPPAALPSDAPPAPSEDAAAMEAELSHSTDDSEAAQAVLVDDGGAVTDACLQLALRARRALIDRDARTLAVVSALRNEGKTTVSCNLALSMAALGQSDRVALVDLDLRRPSLETVLELRTPTVGIGRVLSEGLPLADACVHVADPGLDVYPCLRGLPRPHDLLLTHFERVFEELRERYEVVIFDTPPSLLVPDATIILQHVECFAPVARAGMTRARNYRKMLSALPKGRMIGAILDCGPPQIRRGYYEHYHSEPLAEEPAVG